MPINSLFTVFTTPALEQVRDFYVEHFGFQVVFEADWYVQLHAARTGSEQPLELAFMRPGVTSQPEPLRAPFSGSGVILSIEVEDVSAVHQALGSKGVLGDLVVELRDEPWGQRHFLFRDPGGILVDVVQPIPPAEEYTAGYEAK